MKRLFVVNLLTLGFIVAIFTSPALALGKITAVAFSGPDDPNHPNIVQITIEGGFNTSGCSTQYAAVRKDAERSHLIAYLLLAYANKEPVNIILNPLDKYYSDRCTISAIISDGM